MASPISLAFLLPLDLVAMVFGYRKGQSPDWIRVVRGGSSHGSDNDWAMGGTASAASASDSGSDSSSSDFGGGSSGGGGASGSW
jgi:uncharacterized membrane protein YgcG